MNKSNLLYVLMTARCPLSCSFCMTKHLHRDVDLDLTKFSVKNILNLSAISKKVCISGEGDPLVTWKSVLKLIENGLPNTHFEIITSAFWAEKKIEDFLLKIQKITTKNSTTVAFRLSLDEFHETQINRDTLISILNIGKKNNIDKSISFEIRSITGQEDYIFQRLKKSFEKIDINFKINKLNDLAYSIQSSILNLKVQFKPTVKPNNFDYQDSWTILKYIEHIEKQRESNFHIGYVKYSKSNPDLDITINPNGDVVLYGLEPFILGNIYNEIITYEKLLLQLNSLPVLRYLTNTPFKELIKNWSKNTKIEKIVSTVNNPFWVVRNIEEKYPNFILKQIN